MATVTVNALKCEATYTIIAGGTLNGDLVGPRSSLGTITSGPCPVCPVSSNTSKNHHLLYWIIKVPTQF